MGRHQYWNEEQSKKIKKQHSSRCKSEFSTGAKNSEGGTVKPCSTLGSGSILQQQKVDKCRGTIYNVDEGESSVTNATDDNIKNSKKQTEDNNDKEKSNKISCVRSDVADEKCMKGGCWDYSADVSSAANHNSQLKNVSDDVIADILLLLSTTWQQVKSSVVGGRHRTRVPAIHRALIIALLSCILLTFNLAAARPNLTAAGVESTLPTALDTSSAVPGPIAEASLAAPASTTEAAHDDDGHHHVRSDVGGHAGHDDGGSAHKESFSVFKVDFDYVATPFIIGIWILFASIAKIGK